MARSPDDERTVDLFDEEPEILPDVTTDERDLGWGESLPDDAAARYLDDRPPHWER